MASDAAFEMAQQLTAAGEKVDLLAVIDAWANMKAQKPFELLTSVET
jgi:thioesterase domain-containing protein